MPKHDIIITGHNISNQELKLSDNGHTDAVGLEKIKWSITDTAVASFRIEEKPGSNDVFVSFDKPPSRHVNNGGATVSPFASKGQVYKYTIYWKLKGGTHEYKCDPIIAIKSSIDYLPWSIILILGLLALRLTFLGWKKIRGKNTRQ